MKSKNIIIGLTSDKQVYFYNPVIGDFFKKNIKDIWNDQTYDSSVQQLPAAEKANKKYSQPMLDIFSMELTQTPEGKIVYWFDLDIRLNTPFHNLHFPFIPISQ